VSELGNVNVKVARHGTKLARNCWRLFM